MTSARRLGRRALTRRAGLAALTVTAALVALPTTAAAHSELISADPEAGSTLSEVPDQVTLTFNEPVQKQGSTILVKAGTQVVSDPSTFTVDGTGASVDLEAGEASGAYTVSYRVVSADGHVVRASYSFAVDNGRSSTPSQTASTEPSPVSNETGGSSGSVVWVLGLGVIGLALIAALIAVAMRGRRGPSS